jgi:hypothetical protein
VKLTYMLDRIILEAESPMEAQLLKGWVSGNVRHASSLYRCDAGYDGPSSACFQFAPRTAAQTRQQRRTQLWWRMKNAWRRLLEIRVRISTEPK